MTTTPTITRSLRPAQRAHDGWHRAAARHVFLLLGLSLGYTLAFACGLAYTASSPAAALPTRSTSP
jgi:hypothetical protein